MSGPEQNAPPWFFDHHVHLLRVAAQAMRTYDLNSPDSIAAWHREVAASGSSPMDVPADPVGVDDLPAAFADWLRRAADLGLAQITEAGMADWEHWDALLRLRDAGDLPTRVRVLVASGAADLDRMKRTGDDQLEMIGVKFYADGWVGPRTCACSHGFRDRDRDRGVLFQDADQLAARVAPFAEAGWQVATHAIGDRAIEAVLDAYEKVYGEECPAARPRIEHAQLLRRGLIDRMAGLGVTACIQPCFARSDAAAVEAAFGGEYPLAYRWDVLIDSGVDVIAGSDFPIEPLNPAEGLEALTTGPHPLAVDDAMRIMTDAR